MRKEILFRVHFIESAATANMERVVFICGYRNDSFAVY
jgi:hypothetical protein